MAEKRETGIQRYFLSTSLFPNPNEAYKVARAYNESAPDKKIAGIEFYARANISSRQIREWELFNNSVRTQSVHLEVPYDIEEARHQIMHGDFHSGLGSRAKHVLFYAASGVAKGLKAFNVAQELRAVPNFHINTLLGFMLNDRLDVLAPALSELTLEQSYKHNYYRESELPNLIPNYDSSLMYDPRRIAREMDGEGVFANVDISKLRVGIDHLLTQFDRQGITPSSVASDPLVQKYTEAFNLAGAWGNEIDFDDPEIQDTFRLIGRTKFGSGNSVGIFSFKPILFTSTNKMVQFISRNIEMIEQLQDEGYESNSEADELQQAA